MKQKKRNRNMDDDLEFEDLDDEELDDLDGEESDDLDDEELDDLDNDELDDLDDKEFGGKAGKTQSKPKRSGKKTNGMFIAQIALIVVILGVILFAAAQIIRWQKGKDLVITKDDLTEDYDIESEDFYCVFDPNDAEGYVDDGVTNIVIMGDSAIYNNNGEDGIAADIAQKTGANVTTLSLPDSKVALPNKSFSTDTPEEAFDLYYIALCMTGGLHGSYELQDSALEMLNDDSVYADYLATLRSIDFDQVDILILHYGLNDYLDGTQNVGDNVYSAQPYGDPDSFSGALYLLLGALKERFPHMQIIVSSPSYSIVTDENGNKVGGEEYSHGAGTLGEYVCFMKQISQEQRCSFVDNYFGSSFNVKDYEGYLSEDGLYPNAQGNEIIADHLISFFYMNR